MATARVARGRATQNLVAIWFAARGAPNAKSRPASLPGVDVYDIEGLAPEVKATTKIDLTGWLKQARHNAGRDLPVVIYRPVGYGPERIPHWVAVLSLADLTWLLQQAGILAKTVNSRTDLYA